MERKDLRISIEDYTITLLISIVSDLAFWKDRILTEKGREKVIRTVHSLVGENESCFDEERKEIGRIGRREIRKILGERQRQKEKFDQELIEKIEERENQPIKDDEYFTRLKEKLRRKLKDLESENRKTQSELENQLSRKIRTACGDLILERANIKKKIKGDKKKVTEMKQILDLTKKRLQNEKFRCREENLRRKEMKNEHRKQINRMKKKKELLEMKLKRIRERNKKEIERLRKKPNLDLRKVKLIEKLVSKSEIEIVFLFEMKTKYLQLVTSEISKILDSECEKTRIRVGIVMMKDKSTNYIIRLQNIEDTKVMIDEIPISGFVCNNNYHNNLSTPNSKKLDIFRSLEFLLEKVGWNSTNKSTKILIHLVDGEMKHVEVEEEYITTEHRQNEIFEELKRNRVQYHIIMMDSGLSKKNNNNNKNNNNSSFNRHSEYNYHLEYIIKRISRLCNSRRNRHHHNHNHNHNHRIENKKKIDLQMHQMVPDHNNKQRMMKNNKNNTNRKISFSNLVWRKIVSHSIIQNFKSRR